MYFPRLDASTDMQRDLLASSRELICILRSKWIYFDSFIGEENDDAQIMSQVFLVQKFLAKKTLLQKNAILTPFDLYSLTR